MSQNSIVALPLSRQPRLQPHDPIMDGVTPPLLYAPRAFTYAGGHAASDDPPGESLGPPADPEVEGLDPMQRRPGERSRSRFDWLLGAVCAGVVVLYGCWTILANAVVLSGNSFTTLRASAWVVPIAALAILAYLAFDFARERPDAVLTDPDSDTEGGISETRSLLLLMAGAAIAAVFAFGKQYILFWILAVLFLGISYWRSRFATGMRPRAASSSPWNYIAFGAAVAIVVAAAVWLNRPNPDETLGINMAVSVLDAPGSAIYANDGLHGIPGAYYLPTYWLQSFELLAALLARILNIAEPIGVFHLLLGPLFSLFSILAGALCLRRFLPAWWGWATLTLAGGLLILRGTYVTYGNFAYVRMFEGKSVFLTAIIPLIVAYAVDFHVRPRFGKWILLLLAQVCAIGFTANAIYAGPLAAGFALVACWRPTWPSTRSLFIGLLASAYTVAAGLIVRSVMLSNGLSLEDFQEFIPIDAAANLVLGQGATLWLWLFALTSAWCIVKDSATRHWILAFSLAFTLTCMNPFLDRYWGTYVTAKYLTWRLFWAIPLPILLSLLVTQGIARGLGQPSRQYLILMFVVTAISVPLALDKPWIEIGLVTQVQGGLRVPHPDYEVAMRLNELAGSENPVLAPENISEWVPTFRGHAYPLVARIHYTEGILTVFAQQVDIQDVTSRLALASYVDGGTTDYEKSENLLRLWLAANKIAVVAIPIDFGRLPEITQILREGGFSRTKYFGYYIFKR
jgi:hypothetical protein